MPLHRHRLVLQKLTIRRSPIEYLRHILSTLWEIAVSFVKMSLTSMFSQVCTRLHHLLLEERR